MNDVGLLARLRSGEVGSLEATEAYLERIERLADLGAYITVAAESARAEAAAADAALARGEEPGPLHGLPVAVKDNVDTAGLRTTIGSAFFADRVPERDAEVVRRLRAAGAVIVGKTNLHEFAFGATNDNPHHGRCSNPWDRDRIPGGSSGGSGAAVAAGLCAAALGTDTGGSVRIPGSLNGVSGLRPTQDRVSNGGVFPITWTFDTVGPLARAVADLAPVFSALADGVADELDAGVADLRIGIPREFFFDDVDAAIVDAVREGADALSDAGARLVELDLPGAGEADEATVRMIRAEAYGIHRERLATRPELFGEDVRRRLLTGAEISGADYAADREFARRWRRTVARAFDEVDAILSPTAGTTAPLAAGAETIATTRRLTRLTYAWSLAGLPALSVPCGFDAAGLPIGMQVAARAGGEATLLRVGAAYQRETDWHLREPAVAEAA